MPTFLIIILSIALFFGLACLYQKYGIVGLSVPPSRQCFIGDIDASYLRVNIECEQVANTVKTYFSGILSKYGNSYEVLFTIDKNQYKALLDFSPREHGIMCNVTLCPCDDAINYGKAMQRSTALLDQTVQVIGMYLDKNFKAEK